MLALRCSLLAPRTRNNYYHVVNLLEKAAAGQVHPPSPLRILRFAVANRCEIETCRGQMPQTYSKYDSKRCREIYINMRGRARGIVKNASLKYGIFACWSCMQSGANSVDVKRFKRDRDLFGDLTQHARVISAMYSRSDFVWRRNSHTCSTPEIATGESIGPLVTYERVAALGGAAATLEWLTVQPRLVLPITTEVQVPFGVLIRLSPGSSLFGIPTGSVRSIVGVTGDLVVDGVCVRAASGRLDVASVAVTVNGQVLPASPATCSAAAPRYQGDLIDVGPGALISFSIVYDLMHEAARRHDEPHGTSR